MSAPDAGTQMLHNVQYLHILSLILLLSQKKTQKTKPKKPTKLQLIISNIKHVVGKAEKIKKSISKNSTACLIFFFFSTKI